MIRLIKGLENLKLKMLGFFIYYLNGKKQFIPTSDDIENGDLNQLANRLKGDSDKKTVTNILEWQHKNMSYWNERELIGLVYFICIIVLTLISIVIFASVLGTGMSIVVYIIVAVLILFLLVWAISQGTLIHLMLPLILYPIYIIIKILTHDSSSNNAFEFIITSFGGVLFGASLFSLIYITLNYLSIFRRDPINTRRSKLLSIIKYTFGFSLPMEQIIYYKLAICKDYAKLTAALLYNCSDSNVYFFTIKSHVATAVIIENEYYILDQKLPVLTKDGWFKKCGVKNANVYASKLERNSNCEITGVSFEKVPISDFPVKDANAINTAELTDNVSKLLGINQNSQKDISDFDFTLENYAVYYENNEIVKYSLTRAIKNKLENEFCGNIDKVSKIEISQSENDKDLNLSVYL